MRMRRVGLLTDMLLRLWLEGMVCNPPGSRALSDCAEASVTGFLETGMPLRPARSGCSICRLCQSFHCATTTASLFNAWRAQSHCDWGDRLHSPSSTSNSRHTNRRVPPDDQCPLSIKSNLQAESNSGCCCSKTLSTCTQARLSLFLSLSRKAIRHARAAWTSTAVAVGAVD